MDEILKYDLEVSDAALAMLDSHIEFLARVNTHAATRLMNEILSDIESLSTFPERFPILDSEFIPDGRYRKMLTSKRYLVIYEIYENTVAVEYILDCRTDYEWLL